AGGAMPAHAKLRLLLLVAIVAIGGAVLGIAKLERSSNHRTSVQLLGSQRLLDGLLDMQIHLEGYVSGGAELQAVETELAAQRFDETAQKVTGSGDSARKSLARQKAIGAAYVREVRRVLATVARSGGSAYTAADESGLNGLLDQFRDENVRYVELVANQRSANLRSTSWIAVGLVVGLGLLFGVVGQVLLVRSERRQRRHAASETTQREQQREFAEILQVTESEAEAYELIKGHLERTLPGSRVTVMNRNNSRDRLEARTELGDDSPLAANLVDAAPRSCLAVRMSRVYVHGDADAPLLTCGVCGKLPGESTCIPSLVSGEVIGSVLVQRERALGEWERVQAVEAVAQAAPA